MDSTAQSYPNWKDVIINGIKTHYQVSIYGDVMNTITKRLLKGSPDQRGYIRVFKLMKSGVTDYKELLNKTGLPDNQQSRNYLYTLHWKFHKAQGSSTIEHSDVGVNTASIE